MNKSRMLIQRVHGCFAGLIGSMVIVSLAHAGALVTKNNEAEVGRLNANGSTIILSVSQGSLVFHKDNLLWHTPDPLVDTFFKAARKAMIDKQPLSVVRKLLEVSIQREPATAAEARETLTRFQKDLLEELGRRATRARLREPLSLALPNLSVRPSMPNTAVTLSLEHADLQGFVNYNTFAVAGTTSFTFTIPQPVFSKIRLNTSVIIGGGQTMAVGGLMQGANTTVNDKVPVLGDIPLNGF